MPKLSDHQSNDFTLEDVIAEFNKPVTLTEHGCWLWLGETDKRGYARHGGTLVYGIVWRRAGFFCIGDDAELCHTCPNKNCINPDHLYVGTHWENMQDAALAETMGRPRRVTTEQIEIAKQMYMEGCLQKDICKAIGVSEAWFTKFKQGGLNYAKLVTASE